ncbi:PREDICTED: nuclear transcription factor Y subunit A-3 isoform X1 [Prunus mume]|uniref:Nuclear transcription factor Y subunit n=2 Tax=Prunus mume TaxID=102107 RepID=A0ABM1LPP6_PRUMU|nr:PREDICTED: nuclear transcription factor Y subunit A-3 isoform X1 [Prunus mume]XP_016649371.1 PREDICTED: nuclear transcription factor Y subunit A-3 isoform X1 [Prunus mume]XP_016649372.1 PREDICTED: nuclear transcription factor Y subunit A-3 isoform X1 [Prunus mume]XP_016649373.1 PREDICTED: nuclear transcription factor Y subunit A-3 isoform X1 [Prunus mume]XP_016649374.1 PREDICTED: nuclear transcription factor Y subunit A-3 isoform X1 [Prunus mume]XP_016649375.1 PREDICTED: nuclear transcripti
MQNLYKQNSDIVSAHSTFPFIVGSSSWENSTETHVQQSTSKSLIFKMGLPLQNCHNRKQSGIHFQDQDSSSTQSTGQSHSEVDSMKEGNPCGEGIVSAQSAYNERQGKPVGGHLKSLSSMASQGFVFPSQLDFSHPMGHIPFHYAEPYFGSLLAAACGPQATIHHPQVMGITPARVPLPLDLTEDEPIYVNAKQYRAILRRRQYRAKLEAQNKLVKIRKPYLHESRHVHALKRARGSGGRFLNMKKVQDSKPNTTNHRVDVSGSAQLHLTRNMSESEVHEPENYRDGASTTSCSEVTSTSNSDNIFPRQDFRFSGYPSHIGGTMQVPFVDVRGGGNQHHISLLR